MPRFQRLVALAAAAILSVSTQSRAGATETLRFAIVLSRHGVRTPLQDPQQLQEYALQPWPLFDAPAGYMPPVGVRQSQRLGVYYRDYFVQKGLLASTGCADSGRVYFWSDDFGRDIESAWTIGRAMLPTCEVTIHHVPEAVHDPLFTPLTAQIPGFGKEDPVLAKEAFLKNLGGSPEAMVHSYANELETINEALLGCKPSPGCPAAGAKPGKLIMQESALNESGTGSPLLNAAMAVTTAFELEYMSGMNPERIAWGRLDAARLQQVREFQARYFNAIYNSYNSKTGLSNMLSHLLRSMEQAAGGSTLPGLLGQPGDKILFVMGHDSDIIRIARLLGLSWEVEKGVPMEVLPGCAIVFELWSDPSGKQSVRIHFQSQTFEQLRNVSSLSTKTPPARADLAVPGCGAATACDWQVFKDAAQKAIDPAFVAPH